MFGFVVAGASLVGLVLIARRHRRRGLGGHWLFRKLDASPGQEKALRGALNEARDVALEMREDGREARQALAALFRAETLEHEVLERWLEERAERFNALKLRLFSQLQAVHAALDPEQRERVARWLSTRRGLLGHSTGNCHESGCYPH